MPLRLQPSSRRLLTLVAAAFAIRVVFLLVYGISDPVVDWGDDDTYISIAAKLVAEGSYDQFWFPPGYPLFLAAVFAPFGPALFLVRLLQAVAGAVTCGLTMRIGTRLFNSRVGLLAGAILAVYPAHIYMTWRVMSETLFGLCIATSVLLAVRFASRPGPGLGAWLGLALGLTNMFKSNLILFPPLLLLWLAYRQYRSRSGSLRAVAAAVVVFLAVSLVTPFANYVALDRQFAPLPGNAGHTFWFSNNPLADGYFVIPSPAEEAKLVEQYGMAEDFETADARSEDRLYLILALRWIEDNPKKFAFLCLKKLGNAYGPGAHASVFERFPLAKSMYKLTYGLLLPFIAGGILSSIKRWRSHVFLFLPVGCFTVMVLLFYGTPRFTVSVMPYLAIWASLGASALHDAVVRRLRPGARRAGPPGAEAT